MGTESKLYIVDKGTMTNAKGEYVCDFIATIDMEKIPDVRSKFMEFPTTNCYLRSCGFTETMIQNIKGWEPNEIPCETALEIISNEYEKDKFRRYPLAIALLEELVKREDSWENIVVLHYMY